jgi:hypothetical protein
MVMQGHKSVSAEYKDANREGLLGSLEDVDIVNFFFTARTNGLLEETSQLVYVEF